jgi:hypothetical protein
VNPAPNAKTPVSLKLRVEGTDPLTLALFGELNQKLVLV